LDVISALIYRPPQTYRRSSMAQDRMNELRGFATRYTVAWCSQDAASVAAFFSPSGSLTINGGTPSLGRSAITEAAQGFMTAFPDLMVYMDDLLEEQGKVLYKWTLEGTNTGPGGTGKRVRISGFEQWRIGDDGLVAESLGNFDAAEYQRQVDHGVDSK
jgi:SnoaL-like polyketide cyclase